MNCWKCDVCGKLGESSTSQSNMRLLPDGWLFRTGLVSFKGSAPYESAEVELHVCSDECGRTYDRIEGERGSLRWRKAVVSGDIEPLKPLKP